MNQPITAKLKAAAGPYWLLLTVVPVIAASLLRAQVVAPSSMRSQVTVENWDKGGAISHWTYLHAGEVSPTAIIHRGGATLDLPLQLRPEIGTLKVLGSNQKEQTLDQFINNGAVDGCIVLHAGRIVYEKYPTMRPDDLHLMMSVGKVFVSTALALLEEQGRIDLQAPVERYLPELKGSGWEGIRLRDVADMRSGMEGAETGNDAYRNPAHKEYQLEATLGWQPITAANLPDVVRHGDLLAFLATLRREHAPGETWAYVSANTSVLGEVISRVTGQKLAAVISELIWRHIGAQQDAQMIENKRGFPVAGGGMSMTLRDLARFGLAFTRHPPSSGTPMISDQIVERIFNSRGGTADAHGMLPLTYQWDMVSNQHELAKGGWAGQLLYINRDKDVVVAYCGTNQTADPKMESLPCRIIARTFF
jgi:CubicO group peptidase (beta-lactamase class C family)